MNMKQEYFLFILLKWKKLEHIFMLSSQRIKLLRGLPGGSEAKASTCNVGNLGSIPGSGRSPGEGNGYPLQYSCLGNPMDRRAWWATVHGVEKSQTRLSDFTFKVTKQAVNKKYFP